MRRHHPPSDVQLPAAAGREALRVPALPPARRPHHPQAATITICTDKTQPFEQTLRDEGLACTLTRYLLPGERVNYVRDQLDLCALDERKLFADLDGVAAQLRRYYSPSGEAPESHDPNIRRAAGNE